MKLQRRPSSLRACAPVQYGAGVLSRAGYLHLYQLLPIARTTESMHDPFGCPISPATVERASCLFSGKLVRCEQRIKAAIRDSPVIYLGSMRVSDPQSFNRYAYVENDPANFTDPTGLDIFDGEPPPPSFGEVTIVDAPDLLSNVPTLGTGNSMLLGGL